MKKKIRLTIIILVCVFSLGYASAAIVYNAKDVLFNPSDETWGVTNVEDAINDLKNNYIPKSNFINKEWIFDYTGSEQYLQIPMTGTYKLEVWGAQGGTIASDVYGGYGGYSMGQIKLNEGDMLYINVGGAGSLAVSYGSTSTITAAGGYNGGGSAIELYTGTYSVTGGSGGGATHIATKSGLLSTLSSSIDNILIVSGGGGGAGRHLSTTTATGSSGNGGNAGGYIGNTSYRIQDSTVNAIGGTQTSAGYCANNSSLAVGGFGYGGNTGPQEGNTSNYWGGAGGGGFYGGGGTCTNGTTSGSGGSGYIGNSNLTNKVMYCYNCATSNEESTRTVSNICVNSDAVEYCSKQGNGYAKITLISID